MGKPEVTATTEIPRVQDGVFFSFGPSLPRGRHPLTREEVLAIQRERIMVAFTELIAAYDYRTVNVGHVVSRAGVSRSAFYECFDDTDSCAIACFDRFTEVLVTRVAEGLTASEDRAVWVASALGAYLNTLQADLVAARAFLIEMDSAGAPMRERRRHALARYADVIHARYESFRERDTELGPLSYSAHLATVYAVRQLACDAIEDSNQPDLLAIGPEVMRWVAARDLGSRLVAGE
jgi:AcrR family transcriptional regulator